MLGYRWGGLCAVVAHEGEATTPVVDGRMELERHKARIVPTSTDLSADSSIGASRLCPGIYSLDLSFPVYKVG